jgi:hypothetical protein
VDEQTTDEELYGFNFPLFERLQLLAEWAPLLSRLQAVSAASDAHDRAVKIVRTLQWAAGKSATSLDDEALEHVEAILKSPEGRAFWNWLVAKVTPA